MGTEPRLRIMQLLLSAHPGGLVVGEIQEELDIPNSTPSHHLDKLKAENAARNPVSLGNTAGTDYHQRDADTDDERQEKHDGSKNDAKLQIHDAMRNKH